LGFQLLINSTSTVVSRLWQEKLVKQKLKLVLINNCAYIVLGYMPTVAVGVVGIGHVPGIIANWNEMTDIQQLLQ